MLLLAHVITNQYSAPCQGENVMTEMETETGEDMSSEKWSEDLQKRTTEILTEVHPEAFIRNGRCYLKRRADRRFGTIALEDAANGEYIIREPETDRELCRFERVDELVDSGWAVD